MKLKGYLLAVTSAVTFGLIPLFMIPLKSTGLGLDNILFYRFLIAALCLLLCLKWTKESLRITKKECGIFAVLGLFYAASSEFLFIGYDHLSPGTASSILFAYPVMVAVILALLFKERITALVALSLCITLIGVFTLSVNQATFEINFNGLTVCLLGALLYAVYIVIVNKSPVKASGLKMSYYSVLFSALFYLIKGVVSHHPMGIPELSVLWDITVFSVVTTVLSVLCLVYAIRHIGSTPTAILGALEPVVAVFISVAMFSEVFSFNLAVGVLLIILGVTLNFLGDWFKNKHNKLKKM